MFSRNSTARESRADSTGAMHHFEPIVRHIKSQHQIRIRRWRRNMSGCAWQVRYDDGRVVRWIESPYPRTPISLCIFLHEVGHHVIGFDRFKRRCEEEYHAWTWAIEQMRALGIAPGPKVETRFQLSMEYAVGKALRRGMKSLPDSLQPFAPRAA